MLENHKETLYGATFKGVSSSTCLKSVFHYL